MGAGVRVSGAFALGVWALGLLGARGGACGCGEVGVGIAWVAGGVGALAGGGLRPPFASNNNPTQKSDQIFCCPVVAGGPVIPENFCSGFTLTAGTVYLTDQYDFPAYLGTKAQAPPRKGSTMTTEYETLPVLLTLSWLLPCLQKDTHR
jgi:hypothetical protein